MRVLQRLGRTAEPGVLARTARQLCSDPAIRALTGGRPRVQHGRLEPQHTGAPVAVHAQLRLHAPEDWLARCGLRRQAERPHLASLSVHLNNLRPVLRPTGVDGDALQAFIAPRETGRRGGHPVYEGRWLVITTGRPPFVPLSVGEYLDAWQRQLEREAGRQRARAAALWQDADWRAALTQLERTDPVTAADLRRDLVRAQQARRAGAQDGERGALQALRSTLGASELAAPAHVSEAALARHRFGLARASEPGARPLMRVNPALWLGARPGAVRVVALEESPGSVRQPGWLQRVDPRHYAALLEP